MKSWNQCKQYTQFMDHFSRSSDSIFKIVHIYTRQVFEKICFLFVIFFIWFLFFLFPFFSSETRALIWFSQNNAKEKEKLMESLPQQRMQGGLIGVDFINFASAGITHSYFLNEFLPPVVQSTYSNKSNNNRKKSSLIAFYFIGGKKITTIAVEKNSSQIAEIQRWK